MKFSIEDFFSKCDQIADLVTSTEGIYNGKVHFLCSVTWKERFGKVTLINTLKWNFSERAENSSHYSNL